MKKIDCIINNIECYKKNTIDTMCTQYTSDKNNCYFNLLVISYSSTVGGGFALFVVSYIVSLS